MNDAQKKSEIEQLKQSYNWNLGQQITVKQKQHEDGYYLSEHEKRLNRYYLENPDGNRGGLQQAANQVVSYPTPAPRRPSSRSNGASPNPARIRAGISPPPSVSNPTPTNSNPTPIGSNPNDSGFEKDVRNFYGATPELGNRDLNFRR